MLTKGIVEEDFVNFRKPAMTIMMPHCDWKCGADLCQNSPLAQMETIVVNPSTLIQRYIKNPITEAIVFSGLEPMWDFEDVISIIKTLRSINEDMVIIYTGYNPEELVSQLDTLRQFKNIIVKFGRFIPNEEYHFDQVLGISLASSNQYAEQIS